MIFKGVFKVKIAEKKKWAKKYEDFYGGDLISLEDVDKAKNNDELWVCLQKHHVFLEHQHLDALTHLKEFVKALDLNM